MPSHISTAFRNRITHTCTSAPVHQFTHHYQHSTYNLATNTMLCYALLCSAMLCHVMSCRTPAFNIFWLQAVIPFNRIFYKQPKADKKKINVAEKILQIRGGSTNCLCASIISFMSKRIVTAAYQIAFINTSQLMDVATWAAHTRTHTHTMHTYTYL